MAPLSVTGRDLVTRAFQVLGSLAPGDDLDASLGATGLRELRAFIDSEGIDRLSITEVRRNVFPLTANQQNYTIGTGGDFNVDRPIWIDRAGMIDTTSNPDLEIPIAIWTTEEWASIRLKALTSTWPNGIYPDWAFPPATGLMTIQLWPVPTQTTVQLVLYCPTPLSNFATLNSVAKLPPGYEDFLSYKLAMRLGPIMGQSITPEVAILLQDAEGKVKRANVRPMDLAVDAALLRPSTRGTWDWRSGLP